MLWHRGGADGLPRLTTTVVLARLYQAQGEYRRAEPLYQRALSISEKMEGPEHPSTASTLHALAALYQDQGEYRRAEPLYQRALRIYEKGLGPEHPYTVIARKSSDDLLRRMKRRKGAE